MALWCGFTLRENALFQTKSRIRSNIPTATKIGNPPSPGRSTRPTRCRRCRTAGTGRSTPGRRGISSGTGRRSPSREDQQVGQEPPGGMIHIPRFLYSEFNFQRPATAMATTSPLALLFHHAPLVILAPDVRNQDSYQPSGNPKPIGKMRVILGDRRK